MSNQKTKPESLWTIIMYIAANDMTANFAVQSLRQMKRTASEQIVVAAQFDANGRGNIPRLVFTGKDKEGLISNDKQDEIARYSNMADPVVFTSFIDYACEKCPAERFALLFWGEGNELLLEDYQEPGPVKRRNRFLTPADLGRALANTQLIKAGRKLDVVGFDACNMSMIELAYELREYADFLVASQEEVPDFSLPYDSMLLNLGKMARENTTSDGVRQLCRAIPNLYVTAYQEYILDKQTNLESISLSSLSLGHIDSITSLVADLAEGLINLTYDEVTRQIVIDARANCKGFVAGIYVDIQDLCEQLTSQLVSRNVKNDKLDKLKPICDKICQAIRLRDDYACIIENQAPQDKRCHGLSIYWPYWTDREKVAMAAPLAPLVKGGLDVPTKGGLDVPTKGGLDVLNKGGLDVVKEVRLQRIEEAARDLPHLKFSIVTKWDKFSFIWSRLLVEDAKAKAEQYSRQSVTGLLDERHSAQQCALDMLSLCQELEGKLAEKTLVESPMIGLDNSKAIPHTVEMETAASCGLNSDGYTKYK
jgi:hypothetical protein